MSFRKLLLAGAALATCTTAAVAPAQASIIDRPHFKVLGVAIVWSGDGTGGAIADDFIIGVSTDGTDLISSDGTTVVTGSLDLTTDATAAGSTLGDVLTVDGTDIDETSVVGALTAFDPNTSVSGEAMEFESSFYVASNTAFNVGATTSVTTEESDVTSNFNSANIGYELAMTTSGNDDGLAFGGSAVSTVASIGAFDTDVDTFAEVDGATLFTGTGKTADTTGSIVAQSVRFDATYTLGDGSAYDLSMGAGEFDATVTYTVFVP